MSSSTQLAGGPQSSPSLDTPELIELVQQGSQLAVNQLMTRYESSLQQMIGARLDRKIRRRVDVNDVLQEVYCEASRRLKTYLNDPQIPFYNWLRQIAKDRMIDAHRRHRASGKRSLDREQPLVQHAKENRSSDAFNGMLADSGKSPESLAIQRELTHSVERSIDKLPDHDRTIIQLRHYDMLGNSEVAKRLNLTEPAASMRYLRAIRRLRSLIDEGVN